MRKATIGLDLCIFIEMVGFDQVDLVEGCYTLIVKVWFSDINTKLCLRKEREKNR